MIISHRHKFIFLKTHKTAGTSFQIALSRFCGPEDIISRLHESDLIELESAKGKGRQNDVVPFSKYNRSDWFQYLIRGRRQYFSEHLSEYNLRRWLGPVVWNSYYKFCFERNPYDKVLSYYYWRTRNSEMKMDAFLEEKLNTLSDFTMYSSSDKIIVDKVFLYEELEKSIDSLEVKFGFKIEMEDVRAKANYRPSNTTYEEALTDAQKEKIKRAFKNEFQLFYPKYI